MTIGDPDEESEDEAFHLGQRINRMGFDEDAFAPSMFVEDKDVLLPSTSHQPDVNPPADFGLPLTEMVASDVRLFQPLTQETFVDEVYEKKPPKVVNGYFFGDLLGEGSYSKVKEVIETRTLQRRSIKIIKVRRSPVIRSLFFSCRTNASAGSRTGSGTSSTRSTFSSESPTRTSSSCSSVFE